MATHSSILAWEISWTGKPVLWTEEATVPGVTKSQCSLKGFTLCVGLDQGRQQKKLQRSQWLNTITVHLSLC